MNALKIVVQLAKALAHPTRLRILALLHQGPLPVCQITSVLHSVESTVSGHLLELRRSGLVTEQRQGKFVYYCLSDAASNAPVLDALLPTLAEDTQLQQDAALGESIRDISRLMVCGESAERRRNGAGAPRTARAGRRRS
jgi:ArsR family transcriptional regulator